MKQQFPADYSDFAVPVNQLKHIALKTAFFGDKNIPRGVIEQAVIIPRGEIISGQMGYKIYHRNRGGHDPNFPVFPDFAAQVTP